MAYFQLISCKIKFQLCVGYFPDGRMRTRTFGIGGVRADVTADDVAAVARAVAPLLAHPVVRVRLVRKYVLAAGDMVKYADKNKPEGAVRIEKNEREQAFVGLGGLYRLYRAGGFAGACVGRDDEDRAAACRRVVRDLDGGAVGVGCG